MKKAIQAKKLESLFLLRNCKYTHFTLDKSGFTTTLFSIALASRTVRSSIARRTIMTR